MKLSVHEAKLTGLWARNFGISFLLLDNRARYRFIELANFATIISTGVDFKICFRARNVTKPFNLVLGVLYPLPPGHVIKYYEIKDTEQHPVMSATPRIIQYFALVQYPGSYSESLPRLGHESNPAKPYRIQWFIQRQKKNPTDTYQPVSNIYPNTLDFTHPQLSGKCVSVYFVSIP